MLYGGGRFGLNHGTLGGWLVVIVPTTDGAGRLRPNPNRLMVSFTILDSLRRHGMDSRTSATTLRSKGAWPQG